MTLEKFELNRRRLDEMFDETVASISAAASDPEQRDEVLVDLELFLVARFNDPRFHRARDSELLAWFAYLLSTHGLVDGPEGFGSKSILGHASTSPISDATWLSKSRWTGRRQSAHSLPISCSEIGPDRRPKPGSNWCEQPRRFSTRPTG